MEKHVVEHYPVENLPPELREGLEAGVRVKVTVEVEAKPDTPDKFAPFYGAAKGLYPTAEDAIQTIRQQRDECG